MRIVEAQFESVERNEYRFFGAVLQGISQEPFYLRHEYYENEKTQKQSLSLFGRRPEEDGAQVFIKQYLNYLDNPKFEEAVNFYRKQEQSFGLPNNDQLTATYLLNDVIGEKHRNQFMTRDGKYRKRIVYEINGERDAMLIVFSLNSNLFPGNRLFQFVKSNLRI